MVKKGFIYFLGCKNNDEVKPLCVMLPKINGYRVLVRLGLIKDKQLLKLKKDLMVNKWNLIEFLKESFHGVCLSTIIVDFVFKIGTNYYPQAFLVY